MLCICLAFRRVLAVAEAVAAELRREEEEAGVDLLLLVCRRPSFSFAVVAAAARRLLGAAVVVFVARSSSQTPVGVLGQRRAGAAVIETTCFELGAAMRIDIAREPVAAEEEACLDKR